MGSSIKVDHRPLERRPSPCTRNLAPAILAAEAESKIPSFSLSPMGFGSRNPVGSPKYLICTLSASLFLWARSVGMLGWRAAHCSARSSLKLGVKPLSARPPPRRRWGHRRPFSFPGLAISAETLLRLALSSDLDDYALSPLVEAVPASTS